MNEEYDTLIIDLAGLLDCGPELVQSHYNDLGIARAPDVSESKRLVQDTLTFQDLHKNLSAAVIALNALSDFERELLKMKFGNLSAQLREIEIAIKATLSHRKKLRAEFTNQGGTNIKAYRVAELVGRIFKHQGREITGTKTSDTLTRPANEPSSDFAKCVQQALRITHTDGRPKTIGGELKFIDFADWQSPVKYAVKLFNEDEN